MAVYLIWNYEPEGEDWAFGSVETDAKGMCTLTVLDKEVKTRARSLNQAITWVREIGGYPNAYLKPMGDV